CVDSDGCAMDTMDIKHMRCFGPHMVTEWELEQWRSEILARWNEINLYTMTRGVNRFRALAMILGEVRENYCEIEDLESLEQWTQTSPELTNDALERAIAQSESICLQKALSWSDAVDKSVAQLTQDEKRPFEGVRRALARAHRYADIAIVSNANLGIVLDEWDLYGLLEHTDIVLAQDSGSKAHCIDALVKMGYAKKHVLMCGDAPDDLDAARENGVLFYPILVNHENESWAEFISEGFERLLNGNYAGEYQQDKIDKFLKNLGG
ncbi:MAG: HAD hydrolase-like protein, partial [Eubacteriales bacterium]|nr:HAD hydrolase-like protein [Eubacteriales bacterium]